MGQWILTFGIRFTFLVVLERPRVIGGAEKDISERHENSGHVGIILWQIALLKASIGHQILPMGLFNLIELDEGIAQLFLSEAGVQ